MFDTFQITVCLGERKEDATKGRVDSFGGKHRDESAKTMEM